MLRGWDYTSDLQPSYLLYSVLITSGMGSNQGAAAEADAVREQQLKQAKLLVFSLVPRLPPSLFVCGRAWERG